MSDYAIVHNNRQAILAKIEEYASYRQGSTESNAIISEIERMLVSPPRGTRLILVAEDLLEHMGQFTADGGRITMSWGPLMPGGYYEPTFTRHDPEEKP